LNKKKIKKFLFVQTVYDASRRCARWGKTVVALADVRQLEPERSHVKENKLEILPSEVGQLSVEQESLEMMGMAVSM